MAFDEGGVSCRTGYAGGAYGVELNGGGTETGCWPPMDRWPLMCDERRAGAGDGRPGSTLPY